MKKSHSAYDRARRKVLDAKAKVKGPFVQDFDEDLPPEVVALQKAEEELRAAEAEVDNELQAAWARNQQAVADAQAAVTAALREQGRVESECGLAARRRDPGRPMLNDQERALCVDARAQTDAAREALAEAQQRFKDGVTAEQLADA